MLEDYRFLKPLTDRTVKVTMPSPTMMYVRGGRASVDETVYPDIEEYFEDVTGVYREEFIPPSLRGMSVEELSEEWARDLTEGIEGTAVRAGFLKLSVSDCTSFSAFCCHS